MNCSIQSVQILMRIRKLKRGKMMTLSLLPLRLVIGFMMFLGTFASYMLRVNLNLAIVTMTQNSDKLCTNSTMGHGYQETNGNIVFCWTEWQKSWVKGAFFYGYILLQIPGGSLAEIFGSKIVLGLSVFITAILSLLIPEIAKFNWIMLVVIRILQGFAEGVCYPSLPPMIMR